MASASCTPTPPHDDAATEPVTATLMTTTTPKARKKSTTAVPIAYQEALTTGTPRPAARNPHTDLPARHVLHRTFRSSFQGYDWPAIRHHRVVHLAAPRQRRQAQPWSPDNADALPVFAYDPVRARQPGSAQRRGPAGWPPNVVLSAQMVGVLEHVKAACADTGDKDGKKWWEALCAHRWPLNFTGTGKPRRVQPVAPVGWPKEGVEEGDRVVDAEKEVVMVVVGGRKEEGGADKGGVEVVASTKAKSSTLYLDALREHLDETAIAADDGGARKTDISGKRPAEDWRIDDAAHKRFLSDMQGSIMRLKKSYDEAKKESIQVPPHVRDQELRRLAELEAEKRKDAARIQELEAEVQKQQAWSQSHVIKLETLRQTVRDLESQNSDTSKRLSVCRELYSGARERMAELQNQRSEAAARLEEAIKSAEQKTDLIKDQQVKIEGLEAIGKDLQLQTEGYQENIERLSRNGAISNTKIIELQRLLEEWQSRARELQIQGELYRKSLNALEQEASTQQSKIGVLEEKLEDHQSRAQMLQSQNEREHVKFQKSQTQVTELTAKLEVAAKREGRLEESLGFVARTMLDMVGESQKYTNTVEKAPGEPGRGVDMLAEQDGLKTLLEQLLGGQNCE